MPQIDYSNRSNHDDLTPFDYAIMSHNSYGGDTLNVLDGWLPLETNSSKWTDYDAVTYINTDTNSIVIAHTGTEFKKAFKGEEGDLISDLSLSFGNLPPQYFSAVGYTSDLMEQYPNFNIEHTGNSLGGFLAETVGATFDQKAISFDPPGSAEQIETLNSFNSLFGKEEYNPDQITRYLSHPNLVNKANSHYGESIDIHNYSHMDVSPVDYDPTNLLELAWNYDSVRTDLDSVFSFHMMPYIISQMNPDTGDLIINDYNYQMTSEIPQEVVQKSNNLRSLIQSWK